MKTFPKLYHKGRTGAVVEWEIWAAKGVVHTRWGQLNGAKQEAAYEAKPTNVGRSNERNATEQAVFEAEAMWKHKLERKYSETIEESESVVRLPMLAHEFAKRGKKFKFPGHAQRKLNGLRCLAFWDSDTHEVELVSRAGKTYNLPALSKAFQSYMLPTYGITGEWVLDGELYIHGETLEELNRRIRGKHEGVEDIQFWFYDVPIVAGKEDLVWEERYKWLYTLAKLFMEDADNRWLIPVEAIPVESEEALKILEKQFVSEGFEGAMLRGLDAPYEWGHRSPQLLKYKSFKDDEFVVIGAEEGVGKMVGCATFICRTKEGKTFKATPKGKQSERKAYWDNKESYIGKRLTVKYFELTEEGIPQFPVGVGFRLDEDLPKED